MQFSQKLNLQKNKMLEVKEAEYGIVREPTEGTLHLMRKIKDKSGDGWCESVAYDYGNGWNEAPEKSAKYRVLWNDVRVLGKSELLKILQEIKIE